MFYMIKTLKKYTSLIGDSPTFTYLKNNIMSESPPDIIRVLNYY